MFIWCRRRKVWANLLFTLSSVATAVFAGFELWLMRAETPETFGAAMRWAHLPAWVLIVSFVGFVRLYLRAGRFWLAWTVCGLRTLVLIFNFACSPNLNYREITALRHVSLFGESVTVAEGVPNPLMLIGQLSLLLLIIFVADAAITVWKRGERRQALLLGGSIVFFVVVGTMQAILSVWGIIQMPITASLFYLGIVLAMADELSLDVLRAARLSGELRESEHRMELATHAANVGIWIRDLVQNEIWATDEWRELLGFGKSERIDLDGFLQKLHPEDREPVNRTFAKAVGGEGEYETEYRVMLPNGRLRWIASRGRVEFDSVGKPIRVRGASVDITTQKQTEEELFLGRKLESLEVFAGGIAHDFNNFLTIIAGSIALAKTHLQAVESVRDILEPAAVACKRASSLASQLLAFEKSGAPVKSPAFLAGVVKDAVALARAGAHASIDLTIANELWAAEIDVEQISNALHNILLNARQAMPEGGTIDVRADNVECGTDSPPLHSGRYVMISVRDRGCGIATDVLPHIFDPYFTTKQGGHGLGLATVQAIIAKHDGHVAVQSAQGVGTTFSVYIPACAAAETSESAIDQQLQTGSGRILVMDDEEAVRMLLTNVLKRLGYEVECAKDGAEAIELFQRGKDSGRVFHAALLDLTIPGGLQGEEVAARLREIDGSARLIASSGYSNTPIISEFRKYGFDGALPKPWTPAQLSEVLSRAIPHLDQTHPYSHHPYAL
jgi:two-component system, LuxR family, sensor kinase FixL